MKRFKNAENSYKVLDLKNTDIQNKYILSLLYDTDITQKSSREKFLSDIQAMDLGEEAVFYYTNSMYCLDDFHECKIKFNQYFDEKIEVEP